MAPCRRRTTANLHVFGPDGPVPWRDRALREIALRAFVAAGLIRS
ncbi:MAG: hypothetical protein ACRCY8_08715 [Dermatophilaceae bacterium]